MRGSIPVLVKRHFPQPFEPPGLPAHNLVFVVALHHLTRATQLMPARKDKKKQKIVSAAGLSTT